MDHRDCLLRAVQASSTNFLIQLTSTHLTYASISPLVTAVSALWFSMDACRGIGRPSSEESAHSS